MEELVSKCYAKKTDIKPDNGKLWYLPHHGVKHPSKPGKVRIVFNCSTNYRGASLNRNLLSGPDLINQLIIILMRFRTKEVAFMGDIEAMFYEVKVPDSQRSFFRYLWWNNNDLNGERVDYEMGVHVVEATSSPGCCNYALRKTAVDNVTKYDTEVVETLLQNFYIDDLLKSVESEEIAIQLIKDVRRMCVEGGFNLTKFICNRKAVVQSVPECHRRSGVKNADLDGSLPVERSLGIYWDIDKDTFKFKINLTEKLITRRGMLSVIISIYDLLPFVAPYTLKGKKLLQQLCRDDFGWDETAPDKIVKEWQMWCNTLQNLDTYEVTRCYKPCFGR